MSEHRIVTALDDMLRGLTPRLQPGVYAFLSISTPPPELIARALACFREDEGLSLILTEHDAQAAGLEPLFRARWITLTVASDLAGIGLTAAVATALADRGIAANVVAAAHHDHLFVPCDRADEALQVLVSMQNQANRSD